MHNNPFTGTDSPLSITGSIVGIVALLISVSAIVQGVYIWFSAFRSAPAELARYASSVSNTIDEKSFRLRPGHVPGGVTLSLGFDDPRVRHGQWSKMLQEYFDAHLELEEELEKIKGRERDVSAARQGRFLNWNRWLWVWRRKDLDESVRRVETLRMRKMAVALNALVTDMESVKMILERIEARIPDGTIRLPPPKPPDDVLEPVVRPLKLYSASITGESISDIVRNSFESR